MGAAVIIQDALRQIGLDMQIKPVSGPAFDEIAWKQRALDVSIHSMGPWWNDFMYWAYWMYRTDSATNHIRFSNAMLDESVVKALLVPQEQRRRLSRTPEAGARYDAQRTAGGPPISGQLDDRGLEEDLQHQPLPVGANCARIFAGMRLTETGFGRPPARHGRH